MLKFRKDELSLHMRIPADRCYMSNALLTLEGICDHFSVHSNSRELIKKALESALSKSIELSHQSYSGLFDLKFSVFKDKLQITVEDFMLADELTASKTLPPVSEDELRQTLDTVISMTDDFRVMNENGRHACYSMQFNLQPAE
ncbi:MAG: hypothetical protein ACOYXC_08950 [Candidatus Rifleibacteriota bacterium]